MKMVMMVVVPLLLIGGVLGAALTGAINIPGLTPKKKHAADLYGDASLYAESATPTTDKKPDAKKAPPEAKPPAKKKVSPGPSTDPEQGAKKLAKVWGEMKPDELVKVVETGWSEKDLAEVLILMDAAKTAKVLALLKPDQASKVSRELQKRASMIKAAGK